ncbi:helix-turn-helix transcriptional regulator [Empedobacter falsenii]|uniref:helix-turn-helix domain-containing protein n=1 Tax=Empedobacter falsenii TaxID=343874 RepID=UPI002575D24D|nr:helix-turn-helix domain-containing protein [Empedobacter falsenii]MDM1298298.1 helix-turn-helix transcriptional regulator [Empedobacter falsenii]MDM1318145.1 helix-turn-helix transcriptional regulator [Empedobacter falsenii]
MSFFYKKLVALFLLLFTLINCIAQSKIDALKKEKFDSAWNAYMFDMSNIDILGKRMLENAQTDYEKSLAYNILGESQSKITNYAKSVDYLEKSITYIKKTDSIQQYLRVLGTIVVAYRQAGLVNESDINWNLYQKNIKKIPEKYRDVSLLFVRARMYDIDKNYCKSAETRNKFYDLYKNSLGENEQAYSFYFAILVQIVYDQFKCGNIEASKKSMIEAETVLAKLKQHDSVLMYEFYLLDKALFYVHSKEMEKARKAFDEAYKLSLKVKSNNIQKVILEERLYANIDSAKEKLTMYEALEVLTKNEIKATKTITEKEAIKSKKELETSNNDKLVYFIVFGAISIVLSSFIVYSYLRNKNQKAHFLKIIKELEEPTQEKNIKDDSLSSEKLIKNDKTEQDILKNLRTFEHKKLYNTKGISAAQMAVMLKTNTKYLTYILKEHRNSDFYNYINLQRINYIVKELHDNPALLQYKIAVLSDMCGFNSHSQFTSVFKAIKNISPSQYIKFLSENRK